MSAENVEQAKSDYEAFGRGDLETLRESFADDAEWVSSDELPNGGTTNGSDAIIENFGQIPNYWSEFSVDPEEFIDAGDYVVVRGTQRATGDNGSFEAAYVHLMKYRDGELVRGEFHTDSAKALKALGSKAAA